MESKYLAVTALTSVVLVYVRPFNDLVQLAGVVVFLIAIGVIVTFGDL